jgi:hypothetical protein
VKRESISWLEAEPGRVSWERQEMARLAPAMEWREVDGEHFPNGGFEGLAPEWPFERKCPAGLKKLTGGAALRLRVVYGQGFPALPPLLFPLDPVPEPGVRMSEKVHVNGDGSICLILHPSDWRCGESAAALVEKASGWFIEFLAIEHGLIEVMSPAGLFASDTLDEALEKL